MTDEQPSLPTDEADIDLDALIAPPVDHSRAACRACIEDGAALADAQWLAADATLQTAGPKHYIAKHGLGTARVVQFLCDQVFTADDSDAGGHMEFIARTITR